MKKTSYKFCYTVVADESNSLINYYCTTTHN